MSLNIAQRRLHNQYISRPSFATPKEAVAWFGAVQAQDYAAALWAIGQRMHSGTEATIAQAMADGSIVRTHPMRGTWHFIAAEDVRWFLALTGPRQLIKYAPSFRKLELDEATLTRSLDVIGKALEGGKQLTRPELLSALNDSGVSTDDLRPVFILFRAESDGLVASGARRGKQFTYRLLDDYVPITPKLERDEALAKLTERYFDSHGPATVQDFVWWSGLTVSDAKIGLDLAQSQLAQEIIDGKTYWFSPDIVGPETTAPSVYLLPPFDEYTVAYKDRAHLQHPLHVDETSDPFVNLSSVIVVDGQVAGTWKRTIGKKTVAVALKPFGTLTDAETEALHIQARRYGDFLGLPVTLI